MRLLVFSPGHGYTLRIETVASAETCAASGLNEPQVKYRRRFEGKLTLSEMFSYLSMLSQVFFLMFFCFGDKHAK